MIDSLDSGAKYEIFVKSGSEYENLNFEHAEFKGLACHKYQPLGMQGRNWEVFLDDRCLAEYDCEGLN